MSTPQPPQRRPVIRAVTFDEVGEAIGRLLEIALPATRAAETGASPKVADFLLAWWNGDDLGHFPVLHLCNVDAVIAEDMITIMAYLAQESVTYPDAWGYADQVRALVERQRDLERSPMLDEAHAILTQGIDHLRFSIGPATSAEQGKTHDRLAAELHRLSVLLSPDRRAQPDTRDRIGAAIESVTAAMAAVTERAQR
ncbi:DUF7673 family protein [Sphingobium ummariense]|uniref:DUF7673 domain-containing protein n=1 Tax=Sphingobium ummariense RL-3 TaxID=1346791 RepID=T0IXM6_9SPHN|nr:hypothetical protein M529_03770 [Sphingobium ummariense RL-3]